MAHYIRCNLPQKFQRLRFTGYLVRNAKLIHEQRAGPIYGEATTQRSTLQMNEIKTIPRKGVRLSNVESIHLAKAAYAAFFDEQLPYQPVMAVQWTAMALTGAGDQGSIPEREPEKWLPLLRRAAGAQIAQCQKIGEAAKRNRPP